MTEITDHEAAQIIAVQLATQADEQIRKAIKLISSDCPRYGEFLRTIAKIRRLLWRIIRD